ncbi:AmmeMemoRadiSam system protein B [Methanoregula sp.]|uniref:AmmeMemoRadiSam system protein B n=1 Tax=Methanoregula sp. TaxID=2052170 RepID=UPI002C1FF812|nr:AmmeMemoRadiSam system protein B [Methanoregula sp.]HVP97507.1 AmmeMemoRadiSam system protein B [Methanoregula sp.]
MKTRSCAVSGMFYPRDPSHLTQLLEGFFSRTVPGEPALGIVSPHAGYIYSGQVAAHAFSRIEPGFSGTFVVIGPSHHGYLTSVSAIPWETPLGLVDTDTEFAEKLDIPVDEPSHAEEHSIEVQMPFIKYRFPRARVAPIMMGEQDPAHAAAVAEKIVAAVRLTKREIRVVASSDFSHYVPDAQAKSGDLYAIEPLARLDTKEFYRRIREKRVTACGYGPISAMVAVSQCMGAGRAELIRYATSGDVTGDRDQVVGYAAIAVM